jgi:hypothetical protein
MCMANNINTFLSKEEVSIMLRARLVSRNVWLGLYKKTGKVEYRTRCLAAHRSYYFMLQYA